MSFTVGLVLALVVIALVVIDRLLVWCELRGWIYYRLTPRPIRSSIGNTLLAIEEMYRPSLRHAIEMRVDEAVQREEDGDGDQPPAPAAAAAGHDTIGATRRAIAAPARPGDDTPRRRRRARPSGRKKTSR
jgi:hypothetical protein